MQVGGKAVEDEVRQSLEDYIEQRTKQWSLGRTGGRSHVKDEIDTHGVQGVTFASPSFDPALRAPDDVPTPPTKRGKPEPLTPSSPSLSHS